MPALVDGMTDKAQTMTSRLEILSAAAASSIARQVDVYGRTDQDQLNQAQAATVGMRQILEHCESLSVDLPSLDTWWEIQRAHAEACGA